ncbi:site-specific integrase [Pedobacter psychrodurus]|uniref:Site-specific integrase n=1 Tax=Pedobacter psychrodurus TaxID=2530456 RepID=A0A4R0PZ16_9SPHI|nr:site-specific integrase [Pedobacter psychrodurus]TCD28382.1 site-specific integrase [Pedobacter psychrodurus]
MKTNFSLLFYLKKQKNYVSGNVPIYMRITVEGNRAEIATNRHCDPKRWNAKGGRAIGSKEEIKVLNIHLDQLQNAVYYAHQRVFDMGLPITADAIKSSYLGTLTNSHTLLEAVADHNLKMEQLVGKDFDRGTLNRYKVLEIHLKVFIPLKYGVADMNIRTIDQAFLNGFDHYLRSDKSCANNYVVKNIKNLGKILRICMENEWIDKSPFTAYKGKTKNVDRFCLNKEELTHIAAKEFLSERLKQVRDVFIFCCFTGLAYVDVFKLKQENIRKGIDGDRWIFTNRQKTKTRSSVPLLSTAVEIVDRYSTNKVCLNKGLLLPVPSNQKMNEYLKEIADLCGIEKKLTSHIARHTFATTVTLLNGVPIESVSKMLGHTNVRTTQMYAKVLDIKVSADMALLKDKYN